MDGKGERKQIVISVVIVGIISLFLLLSSYITFQTFNNAKVDEAKQYLNEVTEQYKNTVERQIDGDLQTLEALSTFIGQSSEMDQTTLLEYLKIENAKNKFIRMGFVNPDGIGYFVGLKGEEYYGQDVSQEPFIQECLNGKASLSDTMKDLFSEDYVNCYGVPLYRDGELIGALSAISTAAVFGKIIDQQVFNGLGYMHIIKANGDFVIRSNNTVVNQDRLNIFEGGDIAGETKKAILEKVENGEDYFTELKNGSNMYWLGFKKLSVNDWYLFCTAPQSILSGGFTKITNVFTVVMTGIVVMFGFLVMVIYQTIKRSRESIIKLAYYDSLTGCYNKNKFWIEAEKLLGSNDRYALVMINIGNFHFVNEIFGYRAGDYLLKHMEKVLKEQVGEKEVYYRDSADHFGVLLKYEDEGGLRERVSRIAGEISSCQLSENQNYHIICNCGVIKAERESGKGDLDLLADHANMALKAAKGSHESEIAFYDETLHNKEKERLLIENQMEDALENGEFQMHLQPKIDLSTEEIYGAEALVRWIKPDGRKIFPDSFIPILEADGFITKLDIYMVEQACMHLRKWMDAGLLVRPIAVNQSRKLFYKSHYINMLKNTLAKYRIPSSLIVLEVTEGVMTENVEEVGKLLRKLQEEGFTISMDDFGSGYSSLNVLSEFPIDELKLDKTFLESSREEDKRNLVLKNIIHLAKDLHMTTVVEGVETESQLAFIKDLGCDIGQGYYFSRPITVQEYENRFLTLSGSEDSLRPN